MASAFSTGCSPVMATLEVGRAGVDVSNVTIWLAAVSPKAVAASARVAGRRQRQRHDTRGPGSGGTARIEKDRNRRHGLSYGTRPCADCCASARDRIQKLTEVLPSGAPFGGRSASGICRATASVWKRFM